MENLRFIGLVEIHMSCE